MLKIRNIMIVLAVLFLMITISSSVYAATLDEVKCVNSKITITGTCSTSDQVQVIIFDLNKEPIYLATVEVENNAFNKTLDAEFDLEEGKTYVIKISDYNGEGVSEGSFVPEIVDLNEKDATPKTGTIEHIGLAVITILCVVSVVAIRKKS